MRLPILLAVALLAGCATTQSPIKAVWHLEEGIWDKARTRGINLQRRDGVQRFIPAKTINTVMTAKVRLQEVSKVQAGLALVETDTPNAFAGWDNGKPVIAVSLSYLEHLGDDLDAMASTVSHELAHLHLGHNGRARQERENTATVGANVAGLLLNAAGVPFGGAIASVGATTIARSFTRDEERAADQLGMQWSITAGFDPCGRVRAMKMYEKHSAAYVPMLSTHPSYSERSELATTAAGKPCEP